MRWETSPIFKVLYSEFGPSQECGISRVCAYRAISRTESLSPGKINQRRHADVACPFAGHTVVLGNAQFGQAPEFRFQQRTGVEIFDQRRPPGLVIELLGPIA